MVNALLAPAKVITKDSALAPNMAPWTACQRSVTVVSGAVLMSLGRIVAV